MNQSFVATMACDLWEGRTAKESTIINPPWSAVEGAIRNLNGHTATIVTLSARDGANMMIGGGAVGQYVVFVSRDGRTYCSIQNAEKAAGSTMVVVGGQEGAYRSELIVGLDAALIAAKRFWQDGGLAKSFVWTAA